MRLNLVESKGDKGDSSYLSRFITVVKLTQLASRSNMESMFDSTSSKSNLEVRFDIQTNS